MSGHSKWANIKRQKQAADLKRGNIFSKLSRMITLAVLQGGSADPEHNVKLRLAIEKAKEANMPKENIMRAIERGSGPQKDQLKEVIFEAFGPEGAALLILGATDNINRSLSEVKNTLERYGGKLAASGAVSYQFKRCGLVTFDKKEIDEETIFLLGQKLEAFDIDSDDEFFYLYFPFENLGRIKEISNFRYKSLEVNFKPQTLINISNKEVLARLTELVKQLESLEDIQKVFVNFDF